MLFSFTKYNIIFSTSYVYEDGRKEAIIVIFGMNGVSHNEFKCFYLVHRFRLKHQDAWIFWSLNTYVFYLMASNESGRVISFI